MRTTWSGERLREDTARLALLAPVPCLTHSTAPLCARPPFSCHLPMLCLLESKDFPGGEALQWKALPSSWHALSPDLPAVGSTLGRQPSLAGFGFPWWEKCTAPGGPFPVPAVPAASPSRAEGGQLPGSLFQKGWRAGPAASACDTPALGTLFSPRPQQGTERPECPEPQPPHRCRASWHPWERPPRLRAAQDELQPRRPPTGAPTGPAPLVRGRVGTSLYGSVCPAPP